jgi:ribosomal protein S12 methylthiotransferase|uniref:Ribosomal protein uS12 methylthiotransferase RimO n=1 Tax=Desulfobacca acetoxidans TaxID=60893 RepID=A0A7V6A689_9BACT
MAINRSTPRHPAADTQPSRPGTLYAISLGCPKNLVDTEIMLGRLTRRGWQVVESPEEARVLLVNTCAFITPATQEALDTILELARHKEADPHKKLVVAGCLVTRYGEELLPPLPEVDLFVGVDDFPRLADFLEDCASLRERHFFNLAPRFSYAEPQPRFPATPRHLAYLKLAEGCSHRCTFCTIPAIRGPYRSRPMATLFSEARHLAASGVKELNLVAQDTTAYGRDWGGHPGLVELLQKLSAIPGFTWIRLLYTHPAHITPELIQALATLPKVAPYLDIPIQHAHDEILRRMGRQYTHSHLLDLFDRLKSAIPGLALRTTVMVGFPGETEEHFDTLIDLIETVRFEHLGVFLYYPEEGTPAKRCADHVPRRTAQARARRLKALQARLVKQRLKSLVGTVQPVLVEGHSRETEYLLSGRLITQAPDIDGQVYINAGVGLVGEVQPVRLTRALPYDLVGEIVT